MEVQSRSMTAPTTSRICQYKFRPQDEDSYGPGVHIVFSWKGCSHRREGWTVVSLPLLMSLNSVMATVQQAIGKFPWTIVSKWPWLWCACVAIYLIGKILQCVFCILYFGKTVIMFTLVTQLHYFRYDQALLCPHFLKCIEERRMTPFPAKQITCTRWIIIHLYIHNCNGPLSPGIE